MASTNFINGTPVVPAWLNDVNQFVYGFPSQTGNSGKVLGTDGTNLSWVAQSGGGGGAGYLGYKRLKADYGLVGDGTTDDTVAFRAAIAAAAEGECLVYDGYFRITDTVVINKRLNHLCFGSNQGVIVDVGTGKPGLKFLGTNPALVNGLNGMRIDLNVYGAANCCEHAVEFCRTDRSDIRLNVKAGATAYGIRVRGCLINNWNIQSSSNFFVPSSVPVTTAMPYHHMVVDNYGVATTSFSNCSVSGPASPGVVTLAAHGFTAGQTVVFDESGTKPPSPFTAGKVYYVVSPTTNTFSLAYVSGGPAIATIGTTSSPRIAPCTAIATNSNDFLVNLEGAHDGYVQAAMAGEGANLVRGEIEGLLGTPLYVEDSLGFHIRDLKLEANVNAALFINHIFPVIGPGVTYLGDASHSSTFTIQNCRGYKFMGGYGKISIDSASLGGNISGWATPDVSSITSADSSLVQTSGIVNSQYGYSMSGVPGHPTMETLFVNPFFDIFDTVASNVGPPINVTQPAGYVSGDMVLETSVLYNKSTFNTAMKAISRGTSFPNAATITPGVQPWKGDDWVSIHIGIRMVSSAYKCFVYIFDGNAYNYVGKTTTSGVYETITGSVKLINGNNWSVQLVLMNAAETTYVSGVQYYVGGLNVVKGSIPPSGVGNSLARMNYIGSSISNVPFRQGALAVSGGAIYQAVSNGLASDWLKISP